MTRSNDLATLLRALAFSADKHRSQRRKDADASPYINHPIALANVLANEGAIVDRDLIACKDGPPRLMAGAAIRERLLPGAEPDRHSRPSEDPRPKRQQPFGRSVEALDRPG